MVVEDPRLGKERFGKEGGTNQQEESLPVPELALRLPREQGLPSGETPRREINSADLFRLRQISLVNALDACREDMEL
jgi:hypothetical protein